MIDIPRRDLFIAGRWTPPVAGERLDIVNPATEQTIGTIPAGSEADIDAAVHAARTAQSSWGVSSPSDRATLLRSIAAEVLKRKDTLSQLESVDMGKPLDESKWDMDDVAGCFDFYAKLADELAARPAEPIETGMPEFRCSVKQAPIGVAALITPWNYPLLMAAWKVAPALAAGCCVVLKPSELASVTCLELADICQAAGLPAGVLNVVTGLGAVVGAALARHPGVDKIAFTGSVASGRLVAAAAAANLKPCTLELGGKSALIVFEDTDLDKAVEWAMVRLRSEPIFKSVVPRNQTCCIEITQLEALHAGAWPLIVFEDTDLDKAVEWAKFGCFWTNGQICSATSRLLVQESVAAEFLAKLKRRAEAIPIGDPMLPGCRLGPVVSRAQHAKILGMVQSGVDEGATLLTGGGRPSHDATMTALKAGYFIQPTVLVNVKPHMKVWTEEIFGPVLSAATFRTEAEAVAAANDSRFGLAAAVISNDAARCQRVADALDVGIVWVNCSQPAFCQAPWGGKKESGIGRELGPWGLKNYLSVKQITEYLSSDRWDWYPLGNGPSRL